jgi:hypothetical protein
MSILDVLSNLESSIDLSALPLSSSFSLYFSSQSRQNWEMRKIFTSTNLSHFLTLLNHTKQPSNFLTTIELSIFRGDVVPDWALEPCKSGGRWQFRVDKLNEQVLDRLWWDLTLSLVGGQMTTELSEEGADSLLGIAYSGKPGAAKKISLWISARDEGVVMEVGRKLNEQVAGLLKGDDEPAVAEMAYNDFVSGEKYKYVIGDVKKEWSDKKKTRH